MAKNYEVKAKVDMSQHKAAFRQSALDVYKYEKQVNSAKRELNEFNRNVNGTIGGLNNMTAAFSKGNLMGFAQGLQNIIPSVGGLTSGIGGLTGSLGMLANPAGIAAAAVAGLGAVVVSSIKSVCEFETHLDSLQALTGLDDSGMKAISDAAIEMSKTFPASASDIVDSMKLIGSQAPELLKDKDALLQVTESANILAGAAQIEVVDAAKAITTTMNQMGVKASEASDIINVLAAASQQGSADVAYLNTAFEKAGTAAASAGMNYTQLAAMVESVAPKFSSADVAGSQLASTMLKLSTQTNDNFKPAVVGIQQALDNLAAAQLNDAELKKLVGESNITMVKTLIQAKDQFAAYSQSLAGTNTAQEQFATNQDNLEGAMNKLKGTWDAFLLTLGESGIIQEWIRNFQQVLTFLGDIVNKISETIKVFDLLGGDGTKNINLLEIQLKALGAIINAVFDVLQVSIAIAIRAFNELRNFVVEVWNHIRQVLNSNGLFSSVFKQLNDFIDKFVRIINQAINAWNHFKKALGMNTSKGNSSSGGGGSGIRGENQEEPAQPIQPIKIETKGGGSRSGGKIKSGGSRSNGVTPKKAPKYEADSEAAFEDNIRQWNEELKNQNNTLEEQEQLIVKIIAAEKELNKIRKARESLKSELEIADKFGADVVEAYKQATGNASVDPKFFEDVHSREEAMKKIQDFLDSLKPSLKVTVEIDDKDKKTVGEQAVDAAKRIKNGWEKGMNTKPIEDASKAVSSLGDTFSSLGQITEEPVFDVAGIIAQSVANIALGAGKAIAQAGEMGPIGWIAFGAEIMAQMAAMIAQIHSATSYADGGIIQGASRIGDYNVARVNGGEMILNGSQQANLWQAIKTNRLGGENGTLVAGDVKIKGSDLYLALSNYGKVKSRSGQTLKFN